MRLRRPCEHDLYDPHVIPAGIYGFGPSVCPGGEFLPEDAELVERIAEALLDHSIARGYMLAQFRSVQRPNALAEAVAVLGALAADQVGEPG